MNAYDGNSRSTATLYTFVYDSTVEQISIAPVLSVCKIISLEHKNHRLRRLTTIILPSYAAGVWMDGWMTCDFTSYSTVF